MAHFFSSLRFRVLLLVLLALVPALLLVIYSASEQKRLATAQAQETALRLARSVARNQEQLMEGNRYLLISLAQLVELSGRDPTACPQLLRDLLSHYPHYTQVGAAEPDGDVFCTAVPDSQPINVSGEAYFQRVLATKNLAMGEYRVGRISGRRVLVFGYPILDRAQVQTVVFAVLDLDSLNQLAAQVELPAGATLTLRNRQGTILAHLPDPEQWVGKSVPESPIVGFVTGAGAEGTFIATGVDGVLRLFAITPLHGEYEGEIFVSVSIPTAIAFAEVDQGYFQALTALGAATLLTLLIAWISEDLFLLRRVNKLVRQTRELMAQPNGEFHSLLPAGSGAAASEQAERNQRRYSIEELGELEYAFEQMVEKLRDREAIVRREERMRAQLLHRVITAHEEERTRVARELHDETSQSLAALMVGLDTVRLALFNNAQKAAEHLEATHALAEGLLENIHRIIVDLRPSLLDDLGLVPAITSYGEKRLTPLGIAFKIESNSLDQRLPHSVETVLYRVAQEAITNAARHSGASVVKVDLTRVDGKLALQVTDDGEGFDTSSQAVERQGKGLGLRGMMERVGILGGQFEIHSKLHQGTVITVKVQLPHENERQIQDSSSVGG